MKKTLSLLFLTATNILVASAQNGIQLATQNRTQDTAIQGLLTTATNTVVGIVPLFLGLAVAAFLWFLIQFIWKGKEDPAVHEKMLKSMGYSILAIFVMVSIWGIVGALGSMLGVGQGGNAPAPGIPGLTR